MAYVTLSTTHSWEVKTVHAGVIITDIGKLPTYSMSGLIIKSATPLANGGRTISHDCGGLLKPELYFVDCR